MHRTKDRTELAGCRPSPSSDRQPEPEGLEGGNRSPRETLPTKLQAGFFAKTSWGPGQSPSASQGAPMVHPENRGAGMGKAISCSDCARQTPELLGLGKGTKCRPNRICASEGYLSAEPEQLRPGRCMQPRAGLRRFPGEQGQAQRG